MPKRLILIAVLLLLVSIAWGNMMPPDLEELVFIPVEEADIALLNTLKPMYPESLLGTGWTGECTVGLYINEEGRVRKAWLIRSTGNEEADGEAIAVARASEWEPALPNGEELYRQISVTISFSLKGLSVDETELVLLNSLEPFYPESLIGTGWGGECTVRLYISEEGTVPRAGVIHSSGKSEADKAALAVAYCSKWEPKTGNDPIIAQQMDVTITFSLDNARGVTPAEPLSVPDPVYPAHLRESNWNGQTRLGLSIDDLGMVLKAWVIDTSGSQIADEAARQVAFASLWQPAEYLGEPLDSQAELVVEFSLDTSADEVANALDEDWVGPEEDDWEPPENLNNPGGGDAPKR